MKKTKGLSLVEQNNIIKYFNPTNACDFLLLYTEGAVSYRFIERNLSNKFPELYRQHLESHLGIIRDFGLDRLDYIRAIKYLEGKGRYVYLCQEGYMIADKLLYSENEQITEYGHCGMPFPIYKK